jgi:uncharacterized membrane protein YfhO
MLLVAFDFIVIVFVVSLRLISGKGILFFSHTTAVYIVLFLSGYVAILFNFGKLDKIILMGMLFFAIVLEACFFSYITVAAEYEDASYTNEFYVNERDKRGYYDYGADAIDLIKSSDRGFFRIERNDVVRFLNDALFNEYHGSAYYSAFVSKSYVKFLSSLITGAFGKLPIWRYSIGLRQRPLLSTLTAFKYQIVNLGTPPPFGFETLTAIVGDKAIYKNDDALPLAFVYDAYILKDEFDNLDTPAKDIALLNAVVTEAPCDGLERYSLPLEIQRVVRSGFIASADAGSEEWNWAEIYGSYDSYKDALDDRKKEPFVMTRFSQNHIEGTIDVAGDRALFFSIPYAKGWKLTIDDRSVPIEKVNVGFIGAQIGTGRHTIKLDYFLPGLFIGGIMSLTGCMIYVIMLISGKKSTYCKRGENFNA